MEEGRHYRFEQFEYFAERGMVTLIDTEAAQNSSAGEDTYTWRIPPAEFIKRALAALIQDPKIFPDKVSRLRKLVDEAAVVAKEAKAQGDPTDPSVIEHVVKHQKKHSIVMPGELPAIPKLGLPGVNYKLDGYTVAGDTLTKGYKVVPDIALSSKDMASAQKLLHI